jgi:tetratricopeptide (TPR) repeat protein
LRQRHVSYFAGFATQAQEYLFSRMGEEWLDRLEADYDNFRSTLVWLHADPQKVETAWQIMLALSWEWYRRGYLNEARKWYERAVQESEILGQAALRGQILIQAGLIAMWQSDLPLAAQLMESGLDILRHHDDQPDLALGLFNRGVLAVNQGDADLAHAMMEEALSIFQKIGQEWYQAIILLHLGNVKLKQAG